MSHINPWETGKFWIAYSQDFASAKARPNRSKPSKELSTGSVEQRNGGTAKNTAIAPVAYGPPLNGQYLAANHVQRGQPPFRVSREPPEPRDEEFSL